MTPMGYKIAWEGQTFERPRLTVAIAGSTCIDHSTIGCLVEGQVNDQWLDGYVFDIVLIIFFLG